MATSTWARNSEGTSRLAADKLAFEEKSPRARTRSGGEKANNLNRIMRVLVEQNRGVASFE
jgi:hypothetical protein